MPNPRKRQRKDTPPDFQKKKAKVGKGKQSAENVTQLNFKSGSIVVPSQLADSSIHEPTTHRKLGFQVCHRWNFAAVTVYAVHVHPWEVTVLLLCKAPF